MIPTPEQAYALVCDYNEGEFHRKHARIVGDVMRWYANELGYGAEADFWQTVGILHDLDFEQWPEQHCTKEQELMREKGIDEEILSALLEDQEYDEFEAALKLAKKKHIGPFRKDEEARFENRQKDMGTLVRAGFSYDVVQRVVGYEE